MWHCIVVNQIHHLHCYSLLNLLQPACSAGHCSFIKFKFIQHFCSSCETLVDQATYSPRFQCTRFIFVFPSFFIPSLSLDVLSLSLVHLLATQAVWCMTVDRCFRSLTLRSCCCVSPGFRWYASPVAPPPKAPPPMPPLPIWPCSMRPTAIAAVQAACTAKPAVSTAAAANHMMTGEGA